MYNKFEVALRQGDIPLLAKLIEKEGDIDAPILNTNPITLLESVNHEALLYLDDNDIYELSPFVKGIITDDPAYIFALGLSPTVVLTILRYNARNIYLQYRNQCNKILLSMPDRKKVVENIHTTSKEIRDLILEEKTISSIYNSDVFH